MSFRLVYDRETGRPKGFGFVEFPDSGSQTLLHNLRTKVHPYNANFCIS